jgi:hypothetical protein
MASYMARENREFLTLGADCLWVTFGGKYLWWGFAEPKVHVWTRDTLASAAVHTGLYDWIIQKAA